MRCTTFLKLIQKPDRIDIANIISQTLQIARESMGNEVQLALVVNLNAQPPECTFTELRQLVLEMDVDIETSGNDEQVDNIGILSELGGYCEGKDQLITFNSSFEIPDNQILCRSTYVFGQPTFSQPIYDIIYVDPVGLGRWGTKSKELGIPVGWEAINHASALIETGIANSFEIDPSGGSHFQRHLFDAKMPFMYVHPRLNFFNWEWIKQKEKEGKVVFNGKYVKHICLRAGVNSHSSSFSKSFSHSSTSSIHSLSSSQSEVIDITTAPFFDVDNDVEKMIERVTISNSRNYASNSRFCQFIINCTIGTPKQTAIIAILTINN
ncbi:MAG: hypothetical protein EZS28_007968 [Streblomastix strix]|uniref:Uncharacterized protein n=1 Tax=Streblomastix strix TaxID=222440 RepID=A0A5J4WP25_9EUKA|nr:MAG: hypothetical protein EZS28_007968 [Streblomastix strix]